MKDDKNCNGKKFIFIDTMFWIELSKDKSLLSMFQNWLMESECFPLIHPFLLMELFQSSNRSDFETRWALVKNYGFSNFSPLKLIYEEIRFIYEYGQIEKSKMLDDAVYVLSSSNQLKYKNEYFTNARYLQEKKKTSALKELLIKSLEKMSNIQSDITIGDLLPRVVRESNHASDKIKTILPKVMLSNMSRADNKKYNLGNEVDEFSSLYLRDGGAFVVDELAYLVRIGGYSIEEMLKTKYSEISYRISYLKILEMAFDDLGYQPKQWEDFIEEMRDVTTTKFFGYSLYQTLSDEIRLSNAKSKSSDTIDFLNIVYAPYCDMYVTDAHIADIARKNKNNGSSNVISVSSFKELIKAS